MRNGIRLALAALAAAITAACAPATLLNLTVPRSGYSVHRDLAYGPEPRERLDLYVPDGLTAPAPVLLFFYGGSWETGSKDIYLAFGEAFTSEGFVVAVADYRLYPGAKFPDFVIDGARAFRFMHEQASRYGGDPARIFLSGHSSGAYNAVLLASDPRYLKEAGADISWVKGVIGLAGPYDFLPLRSATLIDIFGGANRPETQPIQFIDGRRPPMLLAAGSEDTTVQPRNTVAMAARLRAVGSEVEERIYPGVGHVGLVLSLARPFRGRTSLRADMTAFIRAH